MQNLEVLQSIILPFALRYFLEVLDQPKKNKQKLIKLFKI